ncbi:MAG TPA: septal ring lytic transglycosylase RlpA family protein [Sandaracinaceae bacterium]
MRRATTLLSLLACACAASAEPARDPALVSQAPEPRNESASEVDARPALEVLRGRASYYSDRLAGRRTANGEVYDPRALTAASRDLPFGTVVRVVREDTGASVVVRINDRGPHRDRSRILDLSRAAAERLDMIRAGVIDIRAEILERP